MRVAVTPFASDKPEDAPYARQFAHLIADSLKSVAGLEVLEVSFMARLHREDREELVMVGLDRKIEDTSWPRKVMEQLQADAVIDGRVSVDEPITLRLRMTSRADEVSYDRELTSARGEIADLIERMLAESARMLGREPSEAARVVGESLRESSGEAVLALLVGWDSLSYLRHVGDKLPADTDFVPALNALVRAVRLDPDYLAPYDALIELIRQCVHRELVAFEVIEESLRAVNEVCPDDWRGWYSLGDLLHRMEREGEALSSFERALELNPGDPALWTRLAIIQMTLGHDEQAVRSFEEAIARESPHEPSMAAPAYSSLLAKENRRDDAHALWIRLKDRDRSVAVHWVNLAMSHESRGEKDEALRVLENALTEVAQPELIHVHLARMHMHRESHMKALAHYEEAVSVLQDEPGLAVEYADCLYFCGRIEEAINVLKDALRLEPPNPIRAALEARRMEMEEPEKLERFRHVAQRLMHHPDEAALFELEQLSRWLADYWPVWEVLARACNRAGKAEKAEAAARRLLVLQPSYPVAFGELATALFAQGKGEEAFRTFVQAQRKLPHDPLILANLGIAAKMTGREAEADRAARLLERMGQGGLSARVREARRMDPPR